MSRRNGTVLCGIIVVSILLRVAVAIYLGNVVDAPAMLTDQRSYHALGSRLLAGHGFSFDRGWYPFTPADTPTAHWSFLYSLFVAATYAVFGTNPLAARLVQAVLGGVLLPLAVYGLGRRLLVQGRSDGAGDATSDRGSAAIAPLAAAAVTAIYGYFVLYAATLMTETLFMVVVVWSLDLGVQIADSLRWQKPMKVRSALQLGLSLSLATLLRQSILPWVPVLLAYLGWYGWRSGRLRSVSWVAVIVCGMLAASILPWTYRNTRVFGRFLLLNSNTGYAMYSAQHPMHGDRFREFDAAPLPEDLEWGNEALMDRELLQRGIRFVVDDPVRYLRLSLSRVRAFFEFWPTADTTMLHNVGRVGSFGLFLPLMVYGVVLMLRTPALVKRSGLLVIFAAFYTLLHVMTWAMVRYRLPVDAVMMPWTGLAVVDLGARVGRKISVFRVRGAGTRSEPAPRILHVTDED